MNRRTRRGMACLLGAVALSGCSTSGMQFRTDTRLRFDFPRQESTVSLPMTIRWTDQDGAGSYAAFVDRPPIAPGESITSLANGDEPCQRTPGCPDQAYLNQRQVYTSTSTKLTIEGLTDTRPPNRSDAPDRHEVIVVLLNNQRRRIGESFYRLDFVVNRTGSTQ